MIIRNYSDLKDFSTFQSVQEMNESIYAFKQEHSYELNKSDLALLDLLSQYSCKYRGVSWLKNETIINAMNKSESTVERAKRKLKKLGILKVIRTQKRSGGSGANLYIIQPFKATDSNSEGVNDKMNDNPNDIEKQREINAKEDKSINKALSQANYKYIRKQRVPLDELDYTFSPSHIPMPFIKTIKPFFSRAKDIYFFWGKVRQAYKISNLEKPVEYYINTVIKAFKESVFAAKRHIIKKDFTGYLFGTLRGLFAVEKRREVFASGDMPNWLGNIL